MQNSHCLLCLVCINEITVYFKWIAKGQFTFCTCCQIFGDIPATQFANVLIRTLIQIHKSDKKLSTEIRSKWYQMKSQISISNRPGLSSQFGLLASCKRGIFEPFSHSAQLSHFPRESILAISPTASALSCVLKLRWPGFTLWFWVSPSSRSVVHFSPKVLVKYSAGGPLPLSDEESSASFSLSLDTAARQVADKGETWRATNKSGVWEEILSIREMKLIFCSNAIGQDFVQILGFYGIHLHLHLCTCACCYRQCPFWNGAFLNKMFYNCNDKR